jgi:hypothetical protein
MTIQFDFDSVLPLVNNILDVKFPVMIRGRHGVGKSEIAYMIGKERNLPVVEIRASQLADVGDLVGLPIVSEASEFTKFCPAERLWIACDRPVLLFLDEVDRGTDDITQAFMELTDSRKIAGQYLHPETLIIAATNGGDREGSDQYSVRDFDPAVMDRWVCYDVEPSVVDWINWAVDGNVHKMVVEFVQKNTSASGECVFLENKGDFQPNKVYPSRRSWKRFNDCLEASNLMQKDNFDISVIHNLGVGFVGVEAAVGFMAFLENYKFDVSLDDILLGKKVPNFSKWDVVDHTRYTSQAVSLGWFEDWMATDPNDKELLRVAKRVGKWVQSETFPADNAVPFFKDITRVVRSTIFHKEIGGLIRQLLVSARDTNAEVERG